jgi:hypothetical protein
MRFMSIPCAGLRVAHCAADPCAQAAYVRRYEIRGLRSLIGEREASALDDIEELSLNVVPVMKTAVPS